jgi:VIT1/CCC1 family predicted Fe2+/Mn2+ transporter
MLNTENINYSSSLSKTNLKERLDELFGQSTLGVSGKYISENMFTAHDKKIVVGWNMPGLRRKSAYLKGEITKSENETLVNLKVYPNAVLPLFAITALLIGVALVSIAFLNGHSDAVILPIGLLFLVLAVIYYPLSTVLRNRFRNKVVKYLGLNKI